MVSLEKYNQKGLKITTLKKKPYLNLDNFPSIFLYMFDWLCVLYVHTIPYVHHMYGLFLPLHFFHSVNF